MIIERPTGRAREYAYLSIECYKGCGHGCGYCYARAKAVRNGLDFDNPKPIERLDFWETLNREAKKLQGTNQRVLLCFFTDAYQQLDTELQHTREVLKVLRKYDIPFQVLTKGGMRAARDFDLYSRVDAFATTMTCISSSLSLEHEPRAATPADRISAIDLAKAKGISTWVSLEPVLYVNESLQIIKQTHSFVDLYKIGILNHQSSNINWRQFGIFAIELCEKFKVKYFIKQDLANYLSGVEYHSTDTRLVDRPVMKKKEKQLF